jgi:hypothetical protein
MPKTFSDAADLLTLAHSNPALTSVVMANRELRARQLTWTADLEWSMVHGVPDVPPPYCLPISYLRFRRLSHHVVDGIKSITLH